MPYTNINQLVPNAATNGIENGEGSVATFGALYYYDDVLKVLLQEGPGININPEKLVPVPVVFPKIDEELHRITVLALERANAGNDDSTDNNNGKYHPLVALPWPSYYQRRDDAGTENFPGKDVYTPGTELDNGL